VVRDRGDRGGRVTEGHFLGEGDRVLERRGADDRLGALHRDVAVQVDRRVARRGRAADVDRVAVRTAARADLDGLVRCRRADVDRRRVGVPGNDQGGGQGIADLQRPRRRRVDLVRLEGRSRSDLGYESTSDYECLSHVQTPSGPAVIPTKAS